MNTRLSGALLRGWLGHVGRHSRMGEAVRVGGKHGSKSSVDVEAFFGRVRCHRHRHFERLRGYLPDWRRGGAGLILPGVVLEPTPFFEVGSVGTSPAAKAC